jgi:hypothetical protein
MPTDYQGPGKPKKEDSLDKKIEKVISGEVVERKIGLGARFKSIFFGGDFKTTVSYVAADVVFPAIRNMMADASKGAIDRFIYGDSAYPRRRQGSEYRARVQYNNPISRVAVDPRDPRRPAYLPDQPPLPRGTRQDAPEFILQSRDEAELVLERLRDIVDQYEAASVADLHDLLGLPQSHVDQKWGWTMLNTATITQVRDGFLLELPLLESL